MHQIDLELELKTQDLKNLDYKERRIEDKAQLQMSKLEKDTWELSVEAKKVVKQVKIEREKLRQAREEQREEMREF